MTLEQRVVLIQDHIDEAENMAALWDECQPFCRGIASRYKSLEEFEDLLQQSFFGICKAVQLFEADRDASFKHYASFWLKKVLSDYVNKRSLIRIPEGRAQMCRSFTKAVRSLQSELGRLPSDQEITEAIGYPQNVIDSFREMSLKAFPVSLDAPAGGEADSTLGELQPDLSDPYEDVLNRVELEQLRAILWPEVDKLNENQKEVLLLRYRDGLTLEQIGERQHISKQRAGQIQKKALERLRKADSLRAFASFEAEAYKGTGLQSFQRTWTSAPERIALERL